MSSQVVAVDKYERRKIESRERIKASAIRLFSEVGVEDTTVSLIVKDAGIAHKTFFNHFPSRNHLLHELSENLTDVAYEIFDEVDGYDVEPHEKISLAFLKIAKGMSKFGGGEKELVQYCLIGLPDGPADFNVRQAKKLRMTIDNILKQARKKQQLSTAFPYEVLLDITLGIYTSTLNNWAMQDDFPLERKIRQAVKFIHHSIFDFE